MPLKIFLSCFLGGGGGGRYFSAPSLGATLTLTPKRRRTLSQKGLEVCYCLWGCHPVPHLGPILGPSRSHPGSGGPVQIRHVLCFTVFRTHPGPEVGAIPACPGPILLPSVPSRIGPGRAAPKQISWPLPT